MNKATCGLVFTVLILLMPALAGETTWCTCSIISPCVAYGGSQAVFVGRMIGGTEKSAEKGLNGETLEYGGGDVRFEVEEAFKGVTGKEITIFLDTMNKTSCAISRLRVNERYLVFAYEYNGKLGIGFCNSPRPLSRLPSAEAEESSYRKIGTFDAETGLTFLRGLPTNNTVGRLEAVVRMGDDVGVAGIPVVIRSPDKTEYRGVTNEHGESVFENLKPGTYLVDANWPKGYVGGFLRQEVKVAARGCSEVEALAAYSGLITGRVTDEHGQPAQGIRVFALPSKPPNEHSSNRWGETDKLGGFEIGGLSAGSYRLYIESASKGASNHYYPGVSDPRQAIEITIGTGDASEGLEFKLPPTVETQTIKGKVVWPDGTPVVGASIRLSCPEQLRPRDSQIKPPEPTTQTHSDGSFSMQGLRGLSYWLIVGKHIGDPNVMSNKDYRHAPPLQLTLTDEIAVVRLTVSEVGYGPSCEEARKLKNQN